MKMRLLLLFILSLVLFACSGNGNVTKALNEVASYIEEEPEWALRQLREMKDDLGKSEEIRARYALLHSMALDKNYIDLTNDSLMAPAVEYYSRKGAKKEKFLTYYYMGRIFQNANDLNKAAVEFSKAEDMMEHISDHKYLGRLFMSFSDIYNSTRNSKKEIEYAQKGYEHYKLAQSKKDIDLSLGALAFAYSNRKEWDKSDSLFQLAINSCTEDTVAMTLFLSNYARVKLLKPEKDPVGAAELISRKYYEYKTALTVTDYLAYAYSLVLQGENKQCDAILEVVKDNPHKEYEYWLYLINQHKGNYKEAIDFLNSSYAQFDVETDRYFSNSLEQSLQEYYKEQEYIREVELRESFMILAIILLGIVLLSTVIVLILVRQNVRKQHDIEKYLEISQNVAKQLDIYKAQSLSKNMKIVNLQKFCTRLYKKQYTSIGELCLTYLTKQDRKDIKNVIFRKVEYMIANISADEKLHSQLEREINGELDNILVHLKEDIPSLSQDDMRFICYCIIGFDGALIATILNLSKSNVYTRKSRIKSRISAISSPYKEMYLRYI